MKKVLWLLLMAFIAVSACAQQNAILSDQEKLLIDAHQSKSAEKLSTFFKNWQKETPTVSKQELMRMSDTLKEAYQAFTAFYDLKKIHELGGFKNNVRNFYDDAKFLLIQNNLELHVTDQVYWTDAEADSIAVATINSSNLADHYKRGYLARPYGKLRRSTIYEWGPTSDRNKFHLVNDKALPVINNFRPIINVDGKHPVYLSSNYRKLLTSFLGAGGSTMITTDSTMRKYFDDLPLRMKFMETQIKILKWGGYIFHSAPYVRRITLDRNLKYARVDYEIWTEGGEAFLKNDNGKWVLLSATRLWIE